MNSPAVGHFERPPTAGDPAVPEVSGTGGGTGSDTALYAATLITLEIIP